MTRLHQLGLVLLVVGQGIATGELGIGVGVAVACLLAWTQPLLRHGVGSFAMGGMGMAVGGWADALLGLGASCHEAGFWSLSTLGMVVGCTLACIAVCRLGGASGLDPLFHATTLLGMFAGEQVMVAAALLLGQTAGHWTLTLGMAAGSAVGALTAGLVRQAYSSPSP
ncbi:MAG: hypothetical protein H6734_28055 [Alphaproteobacteria bacterium]|nr:hypothetical protein [Alphaproteobacteria bacterium]MCB9686063.1 hypothetical protein [Alphaproteobacteria bacterium]